MHWPRLAHDPELAGQLATEAVAIGDAPLFVDFEYDEWAVAARRSAEQQLIGLLDLLSVQAEDIGDYPAAQALAERALRLDRYTDSRYVRLAELLTLQNRVAAAMTVLDDAALVARDMGADVGRAERPPRGAHPTHGDRQQLRPVRGCVGRRPGRRPRCRPGRRWRCRQGDDAQGDGLEAVRT